jgi:hypothetical protein
MAAGQKVVAPSASASSIFDLSGSAISVAWRACMPRTRRATSELSVAQAVVRASARERPLTACV